MKQAQSTSLLRGWGAIVLVVHCVATGDEVSGLFQRRPLACCTILDTTNARPLLRIRQSNAAIGFVHCCERALTSTLSASAAGSSTGSIFASLNSTCSVVTLGKAGEMMAIKAYEEWRCRQEEYWCDGDS